MDENRPRPRRLGEVIAVLVLAWITLRVFCRFRFNENGAGVDVFSRPCPQRCIAAEYMMTSREINPSACYRWIDIVVREAALGIPASRPSPKTSLVSVSQTAATLVPPRVPRSCILHRLLIDQLATVVVT